MILTQALTTNSDGTLALFRDTTGTTAPDSYSKSGNIGYADVDAVRIGIARYNNGAVPTELTAGSTFTQFTEYIKTGGPASTINGKLMTAGTYFVPQSAGIAVPSGDTWETTGFYYPQILNTWLPTAAQIPLSLTTTQIGQNGSTKVATDVYTCVYEIYKDQFTGTQAAVSGQQYMVISSTATYDGQTFYAGEVFIATDTTNIVAAGYVGLMDATSTGYHVLAYYILSNWCEILNRQNTGNGIEVGKPLTDIRLQLEALQYACATNNVSFVYTAQMLNLLEGSINYLLANT